ncbi:MAG: hypothetical protein VW882_12585, partial [Gammaproteobacteria bacterium]
TWNEPTDWNNFDYVIIRSTWDYQDHADEFIKVLQEIENSCATLLNPLSIVEWNVNKHYLRDLESDGVAIVPTVWNDLLTEELLVSAFHDFEKSELIIKPAVSANADDTYRINHDNLQAFLKENQPKFQNREFLLQPFMDAITDEGEYSLFYFNGELSHCILKTPKDNDFRVQEEHGGRLKLIEKPENELLSCGEICLSAIPETLLYARLDFVRYKGSFVLMEAELIEPSLYFNLDPQSPQRFARAFANYVKTA